MKKLKNIKPLWILIIVFSLIISIPTYEFYFKGLFAEYKLKQTEKKLKQNFFTNEKAFKAFILNTRNFPEIDQLLFENNTISFKLTDSLYNYNTDSLAPIMIGDEPSSIVSLNFLNENTLQLKLSDTTIIRKNWLIYFEGSLTHPLLNQIISYNSLTIENIIDLKHDLKTINCVGFDKSKEVITIRFSGHWGESFNYIIPLNKSINTSKWNKLNDDIYWEYYINGLWCKI